MQTHVLQPQQRGGLPLDEATLAERLRERGYATHLVGKWHLGYSKWAFTPRRRGFDSFYGMYTGSSDHFNHRVSTTNHSVPDSGPLAGPYDLRRDESPVRHTPASPTHGVHSSDLYAREAIEILGQHASQRAQQAANTDGDDKSGAVPPPYFLLLSFQAAHDPIQVPEGWTERNAHIADMARRQYAGLVTHLDAAIGRVVGAARGIGWEHTLLVYFSDNGGVPYVGGSNFPWRGAKGTLWEGGVRTPLLLAGGALLPKHGLDALSSAAAAAAPLPRTIGMLAHVTDLLPTLVAAADTAGDPNNVGADGQLSSASTRPLDGFNLWPWLQAAEVSESGSGSPSSSAAHPETWPRQEVLLNIDDVGYPLLPKPAVPLLPRHQLRRTLARTLGWADRSAALRVGKYKLIIGTPGAPLTPRAEHVTSDAATQMAAAMAGSRALIKPPGTWALHWPQPAPLNELLFGMGAGDNSAAQMAFGGWEGQAWLFDLEADPGERTNLLLLGASSAAPEAYQDAVARRLLLRLTEYHTTMATPPVNAFGTFSHGWREHIGYFPPRHGGFVAPYEEPDVPLRGAWIAYGTFGTLLLLALLLLPLVPLLCAIGLARRRWPRHSSADRKQE